jgi:GDPmannose 4,6-dehydratase
METIQTNGTSVLNQLESIKKFNPNIIYYQAGTSEMFGGLLGRKTLREDSSFFPKSPYAISKLMAHKLVEMYRERTIEYAHNGILFNHESPRRSENFVSRKISLAAARIALGLQEKLLLGNVNAVRDWGHARDYVAAIRKIVESNLKGENWVVATGESKSVEEFAFQAFSVLNLDYTKHLIIDKSLFRLNEVHDLLGDSSKIRSRLNWEPKISFSDLVREMVLADYAELARIKEFKDES